MRGLFEEFKFLKTLNAKGSRLIKIITIRPKNIIKMKSLIEIRFSARKPKNFLFRIQPPFASDNVFT